MRKTNSNSTKPHLNIGTIGELGHGKTTLTAAITSVLAQSIGGVAKSVEDIDHLPDEKKRGVTIASTHVEYETAKRHYSHIDCPGHPDYLTHMIAGAAQMDGAILVVSAIDGVTPHTREQVLLAHQMGVSSIVVFLNKADLIDGRRLKTIGREVRAQLNMCRFPGIGPIISGSALHALKGGTGQYGSVQSVLKLMAAVDRHILMPSRETAQPFLMPIANVFSNADGTVVTGVIEHGTIHVGDEVEIVGLKESRVCVIAGLEAFGKTLDSGRAGDNIGCLLQGINKDEVHHNQVLSTPGALTPHAKFEADVRFLKTKEGGRLTPIFAGYAPQIHSRTADVRGVITLSKNDEMAMPGDRLSLTIELDKAIAIETGRRFVIREGRHTTVGTGIITRVLGGHSSSESKPQPNSPKSKSQPKSSESKPQPKSPSTKNSTTQKPAENRWSLSIESNRVRFCKNDTVLFWRTNSEDFAIFIERHNVVIPIQITTLDQPTQKILEELLDDEGLTWSECFD